MQNELFTRIDQVLSDYIVEHPEMHERWLLQQTLYTGASRRSLLGMLPVQPGMKILDLGSGFGAATFDLAASHPVSIEAVDLDIATMNIARDLHARLEKGQGILPDSSIHFVEANAYELPFDDNSIDFAVSRFLFQHLADPVAAMKELKRVLKPEAYVCIIDIDDQLMITYPDESPEFQTLQDAFIKSQQLAGGDRYVGRKLSSYMQLAGLNVITNLIQPMAQFTLNEPNDFAHQLTLQRFLNTKQSMVENGIIDSAEFDRCFSSISEVVPRWQYSSNGQMVTLGQAPV